MTYIGDFSAFKYYSLIRERCDVNVHVIKKLLLLVRDHGNNSSQEIVDTVLTDVKKHNIVDDK